MATREQVRKMVQTVPFQPFTIHAVGGHAFLVEHP